VSAVTFLTHRVAVPAAVIAMVTSFLSYLVDIRSAFLGGGPSLKWIGFCFVMGTVLTERFALSSRDEADLKGCYTWTLAGATVLVMLASPWEKQPGNPWEMLANLLILGVVWRFATGVTRELSPEAGREVRIQDERAQLRIYSAPAEETRRPEVPPPVMPRNPAATVARLAAVALLVFALSEPVLLAAAPQTGVRALAAVVIFLFSTGLVLAAGSAMALLRRAERAGVRVSPGLVPGRMALAALLLGMVLASALSMPGLDFEGTGRLRPPMAEGEGAERDRGFQETEDDSGKTSGEMIPEEVLGENLQSESGEATKGSSSSADYLPQDDFPLENPERPSRRPSAPAAGLLSLLARIGKWLLVPLILTLLAAGIWGLVRLWPLLHGWRNKGTDRWRSLLDRLTGFLGRLPHPHRGSPAADPLKGLDGLLSWPSREAVLAAYHRFLALLESLGHLRPERATPYEILDGLPPHLKHLEGPARTLTDLYVLAAYAAEPVEPGAGERAVTALREIRGLLERAAA